MKDNRNLLIMTATTIESSKNFTMIPTYGIVFVMATILIGTLTNATFAEAQIPATTTIDAFHAKGTINSLLSDTFAGERPSYSGTIASTTTGNNKSSQTFVMGGNWNFDVLNGRVQNFKVNILMVPIDGSPLHIHSISNLRNETGLIEPLNSSSIFLRKDNFTGFKGTADIKTFDTVKWRDVPIEVYLIGGNIINIHINAAKTDYHFKGFPIYGIVSSITGLNNEPLRTISIPVSP